MKKLAALTIALVGCRAHDAADAPVATPPVASAATASPDAAAARAPPPSVATDWCIEGMSALAEDVCYVLPAGPSPPKVLLVYLPGIVPPSGDSPQKRTVESAVIAASARAGVAAIVPRGRRGIGPGEERDWWAWPTTIDAYRRLTPSIVARWVDAKRALEAVAGTHFEHVYLAGSSNGAYYVTALAMHGDLVAAGFPVDGFGAISGGGASSPPASSAAPRPFYVGYGTYDAESVARGKGLAALLRAAAWPVRLAEHPFGHGAREVYLDEAFAFWASSTAGSTCAADDECEVVRFDATAPHPCCTCAVVAVTKARVSEVKRGCDAAPPAPDAGPFDGVCILSCIQPPHVGARCVEGQCRVSSGGP